MTENKENLCESCGFQLDETEKSLNNNLCNACTLNSTINPPFESIVCALADGFFMKRIGINDPELALKKSWEMVTNLPYWKEAEDQWVDLKDLKNGFLTTFEKCRVMRMISSRISVAEKSLFAQNPPDIFISHSWNGPDKELVDPLVKALKKKGYKVWYDKDIGLKPGELEKYLKDAILKSKSCVAIICKEYFKGDYTRLELEMLFKHKEKKHIIPIWWSDVNSDYLKKQAFCGDQILKSAGISWENCNKDISILVEKLHSYLISSQESEIYNIPIYKNTPLMKYLNIVRENQSPFIRSKSIPTIPDIYDYSKIRVEVDKTVFRSIESTMRDLSTRFIPLLGSPGSGKTHTYLAYLNYRDNDENIRYHEIAKKCNFIYISAALEDDIFKHIYKFLIKQIGKKGIKDFAQKFTEKYSKKTKAYKKSVFGDSTEQLIKEVIRIYPGIFTDCVKALIILGLKGKHALIAERWLVGEILTKEELDLLNITGNLTESDIILAMLKLYTENTENINVFYFDDLDIPFRLKGEKALQIFMFILMRLYNELRNMVIIIASPKKIWPLLLDQFDIALRSRCEPECELKNLSFMDAKLFYLKKMELFWEDHHLKFLEDLSSSLPNKYQFFPLNEEIIKKINNKAEGNPRQFIKLVNNTIEKVLTSNFN
ncbi:MAG: toll/interleukin-1 receptor domain-containing protein [Promethearchaeota archaeon]|nr:MAG: toll/interleukin-1 receptor domain-containing protein [Candidatus Lokiarchaeota archaeon]